MNVIVDSEKDNQNLICNKVKDKKKINERKIYSLKKGHLNSSFYGENIKRKSDDDE